MQFTRFGTVLAAAAFRQNLGGLGQIVIVVSLILFCLSTVLGWYTYGESAFAFLFGAHRVRIYRILHMVICALGALISVQLLWDAADVCNGLMAIPNLFSLILFGSVVVKDTKDFFAANGRDRQTEERDQRGCLISLFPCSYRWSRKRAARGRRAQGVV